MRTRDCWPAKRARSSAARSDDNSETRFPLVRSDQGERNTLDNLKAKSPKRSTRTKTSVRKTEPCWRRTPVYRILPACSSPRHLSLVSSIRLHRTQPPLKPLRQSHNPNSKSSNPAKSERMSTHTQHNNKCKHNTSA